MANENEYGLIYKNEVFSIVGSAINVANELGCGFLEAVYQEALCFDKIIAEIKALRE